MIEKIAGFVLAGGRSTRMGVDKALLDVNGIPLLVHVAAQVREAAGSVRVVGPPEKYGQLGLEVIPDLRPGLGPLAGIETALSLGVAEWNLVVACDMPGLRAGSMRRWIEAATRSGADALLCVGPSGLPEPLAAVYRSRCMAAVRESLDAGVRKVTEALKNLQVVHFELDNEAMMANVNTPEDWARFHG